MSQWYEEAEKEVGLAVDDDDDDNDNDDDEDEDDDLQYFRNITKSSSDPVGGMNLDMR